MGKTDSKRTQATRRWNSCERSAISSEGNGREGPDQGREKKWCAAQLDDWRRRGRFTFSHVLHADAGDSSPKPSRRSSAET